MPDPDPTRTAHPTSQAEEIFARLDDLEAIVRRLTLSQALAAEAFRPTGTLTDP